jgi:hypothetical protein
MMRLALLLSCSLLLIQPCESLTAEYKKKVEDWRKSNSRSSFFEQFNKEKDPPVSGPRADRLWAYINEQLDYGGIVFKDGSMVYSLPMTHFLPLPDFFVDLIEMAFKPLRRVYYFVMDTIHDDAHAIHHAALEYLEENGVLPVIQGGIACLLVFYALHWAVYRFTDGIFPSERRLAKETKRLSAAYLAKKRD